MSGWKDAVRKSLTPGVIKWNLKLLLGMAVFFAAGVGVTVILKNREVLQGFGYVFSKTFSQVGSPGAVFSRIGIHNLVGILMAAAYILAGSQGMRIRPATVRDFAAIILFVAFSSMLLINLGRVNVDAAFAPGATLDLTMMAGFLAAFMIVGMSNFGGLLESNRFVVKELAMVFLLVGLGSLPNMIAQSLSAASVADFLFGVVVIHFIGVLMKIVFFPAAILGGKIKSEPVAFILGLLVLFIGIPIAALVLSGLFSAVYYVLIGLATGTGVSTHFPLTTLYFPFQVPAAYISHIIKSGPVSAVFFFLSLMYYLTGFVRQYPEMIRQQEIEPLETASQDEFDINRTRIGWLFLVLGIPALVFSGLWIALDNEGQGRFIEGQRYGMPLCRPLERTGSRRRPLWVTEGKKDAHPQYYYRVFNNGGRIFTFMDDGQRYLVRAGERDSTNARTELGDDFHVKYAGMRIRGNVLYCRDTFRGAHRFVDLNTMRHAGGFVMKGSDSDPVVFTGGVLYMANYRYLAAVSAQKPHEDLLNLKLDDKRLNDGDGLYLDRIMPLDRKRVLGVRSLQGVFLFGPKGYRRIAKFDGTFLAMYRTGKSILIVAKDSVRQDSFNNDRGYRETGSVTVLRFFRLDTETLRLRADFMLPFRDINYFRIRKIFRAGENRIVFHDRSRVFAVDIAARKVAWTIRRKFVTARICEGRLCLFNPFSGDLEMFGLPTGKRVFGRNLGKLFYLPTRLVDEYDFLPFIVHRGQLYCTTGKRKTLARVDLKTGRTVWESEELPHPAFNGIGIAGGRVYLFDIRQNMYVFAAE